MGPVAQGQSACDRVMIAPTAKGGGTRMRIESVPRAWRWGLLLLLAGPLHAQSNPDWTTPATPFRIAGNPYYVGSRDLASYLIVTRAGDILINSNLESSVP